MSDFLFDIEGHPIAFRRSWDDAFVFDLDGHWIGWRPWGDCEVITPAGDPLGAIVGDRLVRRNDTRGHACQLAVDAPGEASPSGRPGQPLPFDHPFAYEDVRLLGA